MAKIPTKVQREMIKLHEAGWGPTEIAETFRVSRQSASAICNRKTKTSQRISNAGLDASLDVVRHAPKEPKDVTTASAPPTKGPLGRPRKDSLRAQYARLAPDQQRITEQLLRHDGRIAPHQTLWDYANEQDRLAQGRKRKTRKRDPERAAQRAAERADRKRMDNLTRNL